MFRVSFRPRSVVRISFRRAGKTDLEFERGRAICVIGCTGAFFIICRRKIFKSQAKADVYFRYHGDRPGRRGLGRGGSDCGAGGHERCGEEVRKKILQINPHIIAFGYGAPIRDYESILPAVLAVDGVVSVEPFVYSQVMISTAGGYPGWFFAASILNWRRKADP